MVKEMPRGIDKLGLKLLESGIVTKDILDKALAIREREQGEKKRTLVQILVKDLYVSHDHIYQEIARLYGLKRMKIEMNSVPEEQLKYFKKVNMAFPESIQEQMKSDKFLMIRDHKRKPYKALFVTADPTNRKIAQIARIIGAKRFETFFAPISNLQALIDRIFPEENIYLKTLGESQIEISDEEIQEETVDESAVESEINKSVLINLIEGMLIEAVRMGASDIHVFPIDAKVTEIHFRIDGKLRLWHTQDGIRPEAVAAVLKDRSVNLDRFEREMPQDGFIQRLIDAHMIRFRVSVVPIVARDFQYKLESIVIRVLDDRKVITSLDKLGFQAFARQQFIKSISKPQGMIIVTGPTGSGKSTTLFAALHHVIKPEINVLTVEDPVEYIVRGARQLKLNTKMNFDQALRAILRHDPDVVMVGEIRDEVTASTAIKLANTGHLTFSTLHTNDAPSAISRLYKMGIEPFLLSYAINIIIAQRLIRKLCEKCKEKIPHLDPQIPASLGFTEEEVFETEFYRAVGCKHCHHGYKGRIAIHEALYISNEIRQIIFNAGEQINEEAIKKQAIKDGMLTLRAAARERVKQGISTLEELAQSTTED